MNNNLPDLHNGYWNDPGRWELLVHYVRWFISENMIWIMLVVGMFLAVGFIQIITDMFTRRDKDKDEDEVEYM